MSKFGDRGGFVGPDFTYDYSLDQMQAEDSSTEYSDMDDADAMHDTPEAAAALFAASGMTLSKPSAAEYSATAPSFPRAVQARAAPQPRSDNPSTRHAALLAALDTAHGAAAPAASAGDGAFSRREPRSTASQPAAHPAPQATRPSSPRSIDDELYDDDADAVDAAWAAQQKSVQGMAVCCAGCFTTICRSCVQHGKRFFTAPRAVILADVTVSGTLVCPGCASVVGHVQQGEAGPTYALQEVAPLYST